MYSEFYGLQARPFRLSPDPSFFFDSRGHRKALAYLTFGLNEREGFIIITGNIGVGKTTLVRYLMGLIDNGKYISASIVSTQLDADNALKMVVSAFDMSIKEKDKASLLRDIQIFLKSADNQGRHVLLVVDEAQNLSFSALEELRMLSNFQVSEKPLFQCFLVGQPQFRTMMVQPEMEQLRQRVIASCHLEPLDEAETRAYIEHRLRCVGWTGDPHISPAAFHDIYVHSGGVPRRINTLCGRLLLYGCLEELHSFDVAVVEEVVQELAEEGTQLSSTNIPTPSMQPSDVWRSNRTSMEPSIWGDKQTRDLFLENVQFDSLPVSLSYRHALSQLDQRVNFLGGKIPNIGRVADRDVD